MKKESGYSFGWRFYLLLFFFIIAVCALVARMVYLTIFEHKFLLNQGIARSVRTIDIPAYRGMILDRNGEPLAVSTLVESVWINPQDFSNTREDVEALSNTLKISSIKIHSILNHYKNHEFAYVMRGINPTFANQVQMLAIPGVYLQREYRRYYPMGEAAAQLLGMTNIDDQGQEGLELAYNNWLNGTPGKERVVKDRYGNVVAVLADLAAEKPGHDLVLSIDGRIQFLAYKTLKEEIAKNHAESGSVVVIDPKNGEILAMANQPSFNPNQKHLMDQGQFRNRAMTDMFEPGSTMKAFSITSALDSGKYTPDTLINTSPGWFKIGKNKVEDEHNEGKIDVTGVLQKSSNVGVAKITLSLPPENLVDLLRRIGFGEKTNSGFPGESPGQFVYPPEWKPFALATLAFGYGISVTPLQLTQAYSIIANDGLKCPVTFVKRDQPPVCSRVIDAHAAQEMLTMLESVVAPNGTGILARLSHYRVAGKTGTAYIAGPHGYDHTKHMSSFVGIAPVSDPQLVVMVVIRNPKKGYYGALVAAPAFAKIMSDSLRLLNIPPDK